LKDKAAKDDGLRACCPICKAPSFAAYRPFCSKRCADIDLHRWLTGGYRVPAVESEDDRDRDRDGLDEAPNAQK